MYGAESLLISDLEVIKAEVLRDVNPKQVYFPH